MMNMKILAVVTLPSIYQSDSPRRSNSSEFDAFSDIDFPELPSTLLLSSVTDNLELYER